nr:aldo/keto reductase [Pseudarthrobacter psychrotolerans]
MPLATLAVAWVLANPNVSAAIVGASRPEQLDDTVKAADLVLGQETLDLIDGALGDVVERDPAKVESFPSVSNGSLPGPALIPGTASCDARHARQPNPDASGDPQRRRGISTEILKIVDGHEDLEDLAGVEASHDLASEPS